MNTDLLQYFSAMIGCYAAMPAEEKSALHAWESLHLDGSDRFGTSDWPGWEKYIGRPRESELRRQQSPGYVYLVRAAPAQYKIGSSRSVFRRLQQLQTGSPNRLELVHFFPAQDASQAERALHQRFSQQLLMNEWFALTESDVAAVCSISLWGENDAPTDSV